MNEFRIRELSQNEGGGFLVTFPSLPGCMSDGDTLEEAVFNAADAEREWLLASEEWDGGSFAEPDYRRFERGELIREHNVV